MNSGRRGVPPQGQPAPTDIASTQVDARRNAPQARFQSLNLRRPTLRPRRWTPGRRPIRRDFNRALSRCADRTGQGAIRPTTRVHAGGRPAERPSGAISIAQPAPHDTRPRRWTPGGTPTRRDFNRSTCADRHCVHAGGRPAAGPSGAISIALLPGWQDVYFVGEGGVER